MREESEETGDEVRGAVAVLGMLGNYSSVPSRQTSTHGERNSPTFVEIAKSRQRTKLLPIRVREPRVATYSAAPACIVGELASFGRNSTQNVDVTR
jgi:hypothetical protein